ncbi:hypothetical protein BDV41DRAFT_539374 [Aspergillus transmontanensis]|uniref:Uncharacterized protein n=1 Tax=Aspergillus transmontanensis TaxID=1034304 RepID=A0A5N6VUR6_9EURO|nr:hypothetical protein BDV41DRAFT_539374 [Aspergillus transmontanensis]
MQWWRAKGHFSAQLLLWTMKILVLRGERAYVSTHVVDKISYCKSRISKCFSNSQDPEKSWLAFTADRIRQLL